MRAAAGLAVPAARPIAQRMWRVDMPQNPRRRPLRSRKLINRALTLANRPARSSGSAAGAASRFPGLVAA